MYKVLVTTDNPTALMRALTRLRGRHVSDQVLMKDIDTESVAEAHVRDYVRHPFKALFKAIARVILTLALIAALFFLVSVFGFGLAVTLMQWGITGLMAVGLSFAILVSYVIVLDRRETAA
jgi:hypothetical protein